MYRVSSSWLRGDESLWLNEVREDKVKYPWRIRLESIKLGIVNFKELVPKLEFIKKKD